MNEQRCSAQTLKGFCASCKLQIASEKYLTNLTNGQTDRLNCSINVKLVLKILLQTSADGPRKVVARSRIAELVVVRGC